MNFDLNQISQKCQNQIFDVIPTDVPLAIAASNLIDGDYWKRRAAHEHPTQTVSKFDSCWKRLVIESHLKNLDFKSSEKTLAEFSELIKVAKDYIFQLHLSQFPLEEELTVYLKQLQNLKSLYITYDTSSGREGILCSPSCGQNLCCALKTCDYIGEVSLASNNIDDTFLFTIVKGLLSLKALHTLDLSNNAISDEGCENVAKLISNKTLKVVDLSNNMITSDGFIYIGNSINDGILEDIYINLNKGTSKGGIFIFEKILYNNTLQKLHIAANNLTFLCLESVTSVLRTNRTLVELNISSNAIYGEKDETVFTDFLAALKDEETCLLTLNIQNCGIPAEIKDEIDNLMKSRRINNKKNKI
eukprot:GHVL01014120.1.p1 GENE.GHVL01014120.1~~GHVL01014120.1.p1  ORF type:complete len:387 (+),score=92.70 GHVL01014120.1:83-1162(+)